MASGDKQRALLGVRNWNAAIKIGDEVILEGVAHRTWSPAGLGARDVPSVFLEGIEEPVPLSRLSGKGWWFGPGKKGA